MQSLLFLEEEIKHDTKTHFIRPWRNIYSILPELGVLKFQMEGKNPPNSNLIYSILIYTVRI